VGFFNELSGKVRNYGGGTAEFQGVAIQPMVREKGFEVLIGSKKDPQFGPVILFGMGGTSAESFKDVGIGFPPLNQNLARRMVEETAVFKRALSSGRPLNLKVLEEILVKFSQLVTEFPEIREIDINPLILHENSAVAVDARIVIEWDRFMRAVADHCDQTLIAAYPKKYTATRKLKNGTEVVLRPIKAEDEERFNALFRSLSPESVRFRFFQIMKELSHEALTRYCNLDYDREVAIVAELQQQDKQIIGAGRVIVEPDRKNGEFAMFVADQWQGNGLGSRLLDYLVEVARDIRLESLFGYVMSDNYRMRQLCEKKGFKVEMLDDGETLKVSLPLA
jgi:acetyltransferase